MKNVIEILHLADLHGVRELKRECLEFIKSNSKAVYKTTGWEDLKGNGDSNSKSLCMEILEFIIMIDPRLNRWCVIVN